MVFAFKSVHPTIDRSVPTLLHLHTRQNCKPSTSYSREYDQKEYLSSTARQRVVCTARRKAIVVNEEEEEQVEGEVRPWTYSIPTFEQVLNDPEWPEMVTDWLMFWGMFQNWQWAHEQVLYYGGEISSVALEQMRWLQLPQETLFNEPQKFEKVIDIVVDAIPHLISAGIPVPETIRGKAPWHTGYHDLTVAADQDGTQYLIRGEVKGVKPLFEAPKEERSSQFEYKEASRARPWDDWDEWDFRVYMEKKKRKRQNLARFAKKQAEVGKSQYLVVSPLTDARFAEPTPFYPMELREHTHEEFMKVVLGDGKYTDPRDIPIKIKDPDEYADAFAEGAHWVPDVIEYCRSIGRIVETEAELIGWQEDAPSATMEEEFEMGTALSELNTDGDEDAFDVVPDEGVAMEDNDL